MRSLNRSGLLGFANIHAKTFNPSYYGKSIDDLMAEIHAVLPDGRLIKGVDVFYLAYRAVGFGWLVAPMRWPLLAGFFDGLYAWFARHRLRLRGPSNKTFCRDGRCERASESDR